MAAEHCWVHIYVKGKRSVGCDKVLKPDNLRGEWDVSAVLQCVHESLPPSERGNKFRYLAFAPGTKNPQHAANADALAKSMSVLEIMTKTKDGEEKRLEITEGNPVFVFIPPSQAKVPEMKEYCTVKELWEPRKQTFSEGYENIRRGATNSHYRHLLVEIGVLQLVDQATETSTDSDSRKSAARTNRISHSVPGEKKDLFGWENAEDAHQVPDSASCAPSYGIIAQPILGLAKDQDIEGLSLQRLKTMSNDVTQTAAEEEERVTKKHVKELLTRIGSTAKYSVKNLALNLIRVGPGHQNPYDLKPKYMTLPLMSLEDAKAWRPGEGYWVAVICNSPTAYEEYLSSRPNSPRSGYRVGDAGKQELKDATELLVAMVKAHAEVANGTRGGNAAIVTPLDFYDGEEEKCREMIKLRASLEDGQVLVPTAPRNFEGENVVKVYLSSSHDYKIPDPLLVAMKAAINWFFMITGMKLLAACQKPMDPARALIEQLNEELYAKCNEEERPPVPHTICVSLSPESSFHEVAIVSPLNSSDESSVEADH